MASAWYQDIGDKLWNIGKFAIPGLGTWELLKWLVGDWWNGIVDGIAAKLDAQLANLSVDLAPPGEVLDLVAKMNVIVPLSEAWGYLLLYLGIASTVLGIKWMRNLVPGMS